MIGTVPVTHSAICGRLAEALKAPQADSGRPGPSPVFFGSLTMLSPSVAALVAVSLLVTIYRVLRGRPSAAIRRLRGPPSPSVLLGECCFRDDHWASRTDQLHTVTYARA